LGFLGPHQIRQSQTCHPQVGPQLPGFSAAPEDGKSGQAPQSGHQIHPQTATAGRATPEMNRVSSAQVPWLQRRYRDAAGLEFPQRSLETRQIGRIRQDGKVGVAAKLGAAVKHARLPAH